VAFALGQLVQGVLLAAAGESRLTMSGSTTVSPRMPASKDKQTDAILTCDK
jgi:hypothetical protein